MQSPWRGVENSYAYRPLLGNRTHVAYAHEVAHDVSTHVKCIAGVRSQPASHDVHVCARMHVHICECIYTR